MGRSGGVGWGVRGVGTCSWRQEEEEEEWNEELWEGASGGGLKKKRALVSCFLVL